VIQSFHHVAHLLCVCPKLSLVDHGDAAAKRSKRLVRATEQAACASAHRVHNQIAIIAVEQKNETDFRVDAVQLAQCGDEFFVVGWPIAQKHDVNGSRSQSLQTVRDRALTASDLQGCLTAKSAAE
jgi:hypothetical protein